MPARTTVPGIVLVLVLAFAVAVRLTAPAAAAELPTPLDKLLWAFPGSAAAPASARSASLALADRWLGEQPFDNPAAALVPGFLGSGLLQRVSRQDLRSGNRQFDEQGAFVDFGGAWLAVPVGAITLTAYAYQPELRLEENAFTRGETGGPVQPAVVLSNGVARELRAGVAAARAFGAWRAGMAGEWVRRSDAYQIEERSGSPDQGVSRVELNGNGFGAQVGLRYGADRPERQAWVAGLALRWTPALTVDVDQNLDLLSGASQTTATAERDAGFELGASASYRLNDAFRAMAGVGGCSERPWRAFGVATGVGFQWSVGGEFHDVRDPWTIRFGLGQEFESEALEERRGLVALGFGWHFDQAAIDFGLLHRNLTRDALPTSYDDRFVTSVSSHF